MLKHSNREQLATVGLGERSAEHEAVELLAEAAAMKKLAKFLSFRGTRPWDIEVERLISRIPGLEHESLLGRRMKRRVMESL